ncbi:MAG: HAMP domain-containing protein [Hormoscilla sp.]
MKQNQALASGTEETPRPRSPISRLLQAAYWRLSLRGKISVPFVSVFLGMWMLGMLSIGYYFSADIEQRQRQEAEAIASLVLQEFEQKRKNLRLDAKLLTETEGLRPAVADRNINMLRQKLLPLKTTLSFDLVRVVDSKGHVLIDLRRQVLYQAKLYDEILVSQALSAVDLSSIVTVEKPAPSILVGTAPIKSRTGVIGAVIVGNAVSDRLLEQIAQGTDKYIAAFNQGKMIASTLPNGTEWQAPPQQGTSRINIGTNSYITKTVILSGLDNAELKLVLLSPLAPLMKAKQNLWITIGLFSLMGVTVATAVGFWVAGAIARPITQVTEATERLASGILTTRLPVISSDELGKLAQGFNYMVEQLAQRDRLLHLQMEQLEETLQKLSSTQAQLVQSEKCPA